MTNAPNEHQAKDKTMNVKTSHAAIVLTHGLWMTALSFEQWVELAP